MANGAIGIGDYPKTRTLWDTPSNVAPDINTNKNDDFEKKYGTNNIFGVPAGGGYVQ